MSIRLLASALHVRTNVLVVQHLVPGYLIRQSM